MRTRTTRSLSNGEGQGASQGQGWGPARGASRSRKAAPHRTGNRSTAGHAAPDRERLAAKQARAEALTNLLEDIDYTAESAATRIAASVACLNRLDGPCRTMVEIAAERGAAPKPGGIKVRFADE